MSNFFQEHFIVNIATLIPAAITLVVAIIGTLVSKEKDFQEKSKELLEKLLDKKVSILRLLFESIEFVPNSLGGVTEFKGKRYFVEIEKFTLLERKVTWNCRLYRFVISLFYYSMVVSLLLALGSFIKAPYLGGIMTTLSILSIIFVATGIVLMRKAETKISRISEISELMHNE